MASCCGSAASAATTAEDAAGGALYELANGCLCCTVQEEFVPVLETLLERRDRIDHILIETSGLALPKPLVQAFQWPQIRAACTVDAVIALVDGPGRARRAASPHDPAAVDEQRREDPEPRSRSAAARAVRRSAVGRGPGDREQGGRAATPAASSACAADRGARRAGA